MISGFKSFNFSLAYAHYMKKWIPPISPFGIDGNRYVWGYRWLPLRTKDPSWRDPNQREGCVRSYKHAQLRSWSIIHAWWRINRVAYLSTLSKNNWILTSYNRRLWIEVCRWRFLLASKYATPLQTAPRRRLSTPFPSNSAFSSERSFCSIYIMKMWSILWAQKCSIHPCRRLWIWHQVWLHQITAQLPSSEQLQPRRGEAGQGGLFLWRKQR